MHTPYSASVAWLSGVAVRTFIIMVLSIPVRISYATGDVSGFDMVYTALWAGVLWFILAESLFLFILLLTKKRRRSRYGYSRSHRR